MRVRQEPDVDHEIGVARAPVLEAERHDRDLEPGLGRPAGERVAHPVAELVGGEPRRVDHEVGVAAQLREDLALLADPLDDPVGRRERVAAAGRLVPSHQIFVGGLEEHDPGLALERAEVLQRLRELAEEDAAPRVDHDRDAGGRARAHRQLGHLRQQRRWQVVDDEEPEVLERACDLRTTGAGQAGDQGEAVARGRRRRSCARPPVDGCVQVVVHGRRHLPAPRPAWRRSPRPTRRAAS